MKSKFFVKLVWLVIFCLTVVNGEVAQAGSPEIAGLPSGLPLDPQSTEVFWDDFFEREMDNLGVHGAVMVMVAGDETVFAKGYGYADAANHIPIDPESTILRAGSIAKTVTATAIMQLTEAGQLDLDADVNEYLTSFKIPDTFPEPVTARHLINMTGGFDTRAVGIRASSRAEVRPLGDYLAERMPPRVLPPGRYRRYNDHEVALAGYLVETTSGMPYENYVRQHIFEPLEMNDSSILLPDKELPRAALGYPVGAGPDGAFPLSYYYLNDAPGAGFNTTAIDMAHYLMAHLGGGLYLRSDGKQSRIFGEATAEQFHQTAFCYHAGMPGQANSFDERFYNGRRYLRKQGGAPGMQNDLMLLLDEDLGFYLFYNSEGTALRNDWEDLIAKTYLSGVLSQPDNLRASSYSGEVNAANYAGNYMQVSDQTSQTTIVQVQALVDPDLWLRVEKGGPDSLIIAGQNYFEVEPTLFQNPRSGAYKAFELGTDGEARFLFQDRFAYQRVPWLQTPPVQLGFLGFGVLVFLLAFLTGLFGLLRRKQSGRLLAGMIAGLNLVFLASLTWILLPVATGGDIWQFSFYPSFELRLVLAIPLLTSMLAVGLLFDTIHAWKSGKYRPLTRLFNSLTLAGVAAFTYFLHTWNLLGWRF
jgi:CubicO group peptidase (beta-lactamase class C family)